MAVAREEGYCEETEVPFGAHLAIGFSGRPYRAPRCLTAEKPTLILAVSPGVGSSSNFRRSGTLVSISDAERLADVVSESLRARNEFTPFDPGPANRYHEPYARVAFAR
jgi:hypothetical protein